MYSNPCPKKVVRCKSICGCLARPKDRWGITEYIEEKPTVATIRTAIVTNILAPYRVPLFERLASEPGIELKVFLLAPKESNRQWRLDPKDVLGFEVALVPGVHGFFSKWDLPIHFNWGLLGMLERYCPDVVVISGYDAPAYWFATWWARWRDCRVILWNGTTPLSVRSDSGILGRIKRRVAAWSDAAVTYGTCATEYAIRLGIPSERVFTGLNTVDMDSLSQNVFEFRKSGSFRSQRVHYPRLLLLFSGQLIERKGIPNLLRALELLHDPEIGLLVVGSGPLERGLQEATRDGRIPNVFFEGFRQPRELSRYYGLADVLVLPSLSEVWGLVVNEALASGLFVLCSDRAGAGYDLIEEGWNGSLFDPQDITGLAERIQSLKEQLPEITARQKAIAAHACSKFSIEKSAQVFLRAIREVAS